MPSGGGPVTTVWWSFTPLPQATGFCVQVSPLSSLNCR